VGEQAGDESWTFNFFYSYIKVKPATDLLSLRAKFNNYVAEARAESLKAVGASFDFRFIPVTDIHLKSDVQFELEGNGDARLVNALGITGIIILIVAWINFINLSTARGTRRAKEIGVRKVLGAAKRQLVFQFVMEALLLNVVALVLSLFLVRLGLPFFAEMIDVPLQFMTTSFLLSDPKYVMVASAVFCMGVVLSVIYPAFVLSSYSPVKALKSDVLKPKGITFRKSLIVVQMIISLVMIAGTFVVYRQVTFMRSTDLGIDIAKVLVVEAPEILDNANKSAANVFKLEIEKLPFVNGFSMSSVVPGQEVTFRSYNLSNEKTKATINCGIIGIDVNFFTNFDVPLISGKTFSSADSSNSGVILNEEAISQLGFANAEQAIGATISHDNKGQNSKFVIQGVVKNYHHRSLQRSIEPIMFMNGRDLKYYSIKLQEQAWSALESNVAWIGKSYDQIFPGNAYNYFFLDQNFNDQYTSEIKFGTIFFGFSILAIIISALGLLGLSTFMISLRNREVGIRKVMGADTLSITKLFMKDYFSLLLISIIVGIPVSYYLSLYWLRNFAFKIEVGPLLFVVPVLMISAVIISAVGVQSVKAASRNPVDEIGNR
jgi:putative ABC transport system permease protein